MRTTIRRAVVTMCTASLLLTSAPTAQAASPGAIEIATAAAQAAYQAYKLLKDGSLSLSQATQRIINAINQAKTEIIEEIDKMAAADVRACARTAVIEIADIARMSRPTRENFASQTTNCTNRAQELIGTVSSKATVDQLGIAVNAVGPIAVFARAYAYGANSGSIPPLRADLVQANQTVVSRLNPSCSAAPLWGDAEPGAPVEVLLTCRSYDNKLGRDAVWLRIRRGDPLPPLDYSNARRSAMRHSSWTIAKAVLPAL